MQSKDIQDIIKEAIESLQKISKNLPPSCSALSQELENSIKESNDL